MRISDWSSDVCSSDLIAVHAPNKSVARWDLARDYYGSTTPMQLCTTAMAVMRAISSQPLTLGVMAMPEDGEKDAWWPMLASRSAETPKVVARLPFVPNPAGSYADLGDRNSVVEGKSVSGLVDLGGSRIIKKK